MDIFRRLQRLTAVCRSAYTFARFLVPLLFARCAASKLALSLHLGSLFLLYYVTCLLSLIAWLLLVSCQFSFTTLHFDLPFNLFFDFIIIIFLLCFVSCLCVLELKKRARARSRSVRNVLWYLLSFRRDTCIFKFCQNATELKVCG